MLLKEVLSPEQRLTFLRLKLQKQQEQLRNDIRNKHVKKCIEKALAEITQLEAENGSIQTLHQGH